MKGRQVRAMDAEKLIGQLRTKDRKALLYFIIPGFGVDDEIVQKGFHIKNIAFHKLYQFAAAVDDDGCRSS